MLFSKETYTGRRASLRERVGDGLILIMGNNDSPMNYPANTYKFRQDSTFLYFFGQHRNGLVGVIDADSGDETLYGDEIDIDDIVWYGSVTSVRQMADECGVATTAPMAALADAVAQAASHNMVIRLIGEVSDTKLEVSPRLIPAGHPLGISGTLNIAQIDADLAGPITINGRGAGKIETASAILSDLIAILDERHGHA